MKPKLSEKMHLCLPTTFCPKCEQLMCGICLEEGVKKFGVCYKCKQTVTLEEIQNRKNEEEVRRSMSEQSPPTQAKIRLSPRMYHSQTIQVFLSQQSSSLPSSASVSRNSIASSEISFDYQTQNGFNPHKSISSSRGDPAGSNTTNSPRSVAEKTYISDERFNLFKPPMLNDKVTFTKEAGNDVKIIQYATLEKCLFMIVSSQCEDSYFLQCFVYSYKLITTTSNLLDLLLILLNPQKEKEVSWKDFCNNILFPYRAKILAILKLLIHTFPEDFQRDELSEKIEIICDVLRFCNKSNSDMLMSCLDKARTKKLLVIPTLKTVSLINYDKVTGILRYSPIDFAEQVTVMQMENFVKIPPSEFLNQGWTKKNKEELTPNIVKMIKFSNKIINIVQTQIVMQTSYPLRTLAIFYFITVADIMRKLQNFDGMKTVMSALQATAVFRLKTSWDMLPSKTKNIFDELSKLCSEDNNFNELRMAMKVATPPTIPFIGSTLTDLIYTADGNKTNNGEESVINFYKLRGIGNLIKEIMLKQKTPYVIAEDRRAQEGMMSVAVVEDEETLFEISTNNEPKLFDKVEDASKKPNKGEGKHAKDLIKSYVKHAK
ncbi:guanine nucleotide exchange factor, putative [Entamoeba invadens IP1]|uniref:Guanine nucleotide exchange factor, putative n=1 Tax=Entamoeba invadens IP1 TaxID=370355 RepID=A0A0A1U8M8_ENTIV|nr:guanine nucleotide exchange factor, putative [Entamoeba invadens IP1]ELP88338.1 guanine nucleotide exchange factor, putative [Entamoeba invadens IP1]|eukprot:XP_004255109.1 guanine nucleotide exchange factor, putative [Entamoeba invadens IP1]